MEKICSRQNYTLTDFPGYKIETIFEVFFRLNYEVGFFSSKKKLLVYRKNLFLFRFKFLLNYFLKKKRKKKA